VAVAENCAELAPAGMVTEAGTGNVARLLDRLTLADTTAFLLKATVQVAEALLDSDDGAQESDIS